MIRGQPGSTLFPYTTLFRSKIDQGHRERAPVHHRVRPLRRGARAAHRLGELEAARYVGRDGREVLQFDQPRSEEHTSELQSHSDLVCRLLLEKKKTKQTINS